MDATYTAVIRLYEQRESIRQIALRLGISESKARKILITSGLYTTPDITYAIRRRKDGASLEQIAEELSVTPNAVSGMLPYSKGAYNAEYPTINALRIRKSRGRKETKNETG